MIASIINEKENKNLVNAVKDFIASSYKNEEALERIERALQNGADKNLTIEIKEGEQKSILLILEDFKKIIGERIEKNIKELSQIKNPEAYQNLEKVETASIKTVRDCELIKRIDKIEEKYFGVDFSPKSVLRI
jgi:hypothetical protein